MPKLDVAIVVDSTVTLPDEIVQKYDLHVVPQIVNWSGKSYYDGLDIQAVEFYQRLATAKEMPTTSQPSAGEFFETFTQVAKTAESILCLTISDELSGTLASAEAAAAMMDDYPVVVIDSRSTSLGMGFMVIAAAEAIKNGAGLNEAAQVVRDLVDVMRVCFVVDTLEFLHRGGRIGGAQRLIGSVLSIKPVLQIENGRIEPLASVRTKRKAIDYLIDLVQKEMSGRNNIHIAIMDAVAHDEARRIGGILQDQLKPAQLLYGELSPVIGTHVGPGTIGVAFYADPIQ